jgi:hypothetical protein
MLKATAAELAPYAGPFYSEELDATYTLAVEKGALMLRRPAAPPQPLVPVARDEFMAGPAMVTFARGADGRVTGYVLDIGRVRNLRFDRRPDRMPSR